MREQISKLIKELFSGKVEKTFTDKDISNVLNQSNVYTFFHRENNEVVAMLTLYVVYLFSRRLGVIEEVCTMKEYRNQGIGSGLVKKAIKKATDLGCNCIELNVRSDKPEIQKFYEGLGFIDRNNKSMRLWINKK